MPTIPPHFEDLPIGVLLHDPETADIIYANEHIQDLLGYSAPELESMDVGEFSGKSFTQEEAVQRVRAATDGNSQRFEWRAQTATGDLLWIDVQLTDTSINDTQYVLALVWDITEYKMNKRQLRVLARITRHNLRNELTIIGGAIDQIDTDGLDDSTTTNLRRIQSSTDDLLELTDWIDNVKSMTVGEVSQEPLNLGALVTELTDTWQAEYPEITWDVECEPVWAAAKHQLETAVEELIENAVGHNPHDDLQITVTATTDPEAEQACIRVADTGQPIPEMEVEPIAEGYDPEPLGHGEGIGLWQAQTIVTAYSGRLSVKENTPERKEIEIALPQVTPPEDAG